ncbi:MAG: hypothetical protein NUW37_12670 [Planctomycetes bacterium]|nr:hypothetical protein [Planctomycetota bacterium]
MPPRKIWKLPACMKIEEVTPLELASIEGVNEGLDPHRSDYDYRAFVLFYDGIPAYRLLYTKKIDRGILWDGYAPEGIRGKRLQLWMLRILPQMLACDPDLKLMMASSEAGNPSSLSSIRRAGFRYLIPTFSGKLFGIPIGQALTSFIRRTSGNWKSLTNVQDRL